MTSAIIFDCEFLTAEGAPSRFWCGPHDPDPVIVQIGAVRLGLSDDFPVLETLRSFIKPVDRCGAAYPLDPLFINLTGITEDQVAAEGMTLAEALNALKTFAEGAKLWSWGKDEFNMVAISCYVAGIAPVIPVTQFDNACKLILKAGMSKDVLHKTRSHMLADHYGIEHPPLRGHDALDDALSVAYVVQHFLREKTLSADDLV